MKPRTGLLVLLALATALAAAGAASCSACTSPLALAGALFYAAMFCVTLLAGPNRFVAVALLAAFGFHAGLVGSGYACPLCWASAACSLVMAVLLVHEHAGAWVVTPFAAAAGLLLAPPPTPPGVVTVYEQPGCPYCTELRERVMPEAVEGLAVTVRYLDAPRSIRVTPTILVGRRTIEGLPSPAYLRTAIQEGLMP